jgi:hypothetical protein
MRCQASFYERLFDQVEFWEVVRQEEQLGASGADCSAGGVAFLWLPRSSKTTASPRFRAPMLAFFRPGWVNLTSRLSEIPIQPN